MVERMKRLTFVCEHAELELKYPVSNYVRRFNIHEVLPPRWSSRVARARVEWWMQIHPDDSEPLLLVGRRVCKALGLGNDATWFDWYGVADNSHPLIPFPLGSNGRALKLIDQLVTGELPRYERGIKDETA